MCHFCEIMNGFHRGLTESHLIDGLLDLRFLRFSTGEDQVSSERSDELQLLPQAVRLRLDGLEHTIQEVRFLHRGPLAHLFLPGSSY